MATKLHVKKGDMVQVISGENAGKSGKVLSVDIDAQRVVIDGVNIVKRHSRPSRTNPQGGVIESPGPVHVSNVMVVCPNCNKPTRAGRDEVKGERVRTCKRCGKAVD